MKRLLLYVTLLTMLCGCKGAAPKYKEEFWFNIASDRRGRDFHFPAPLRSELFLDAQTAIDIKSVTCDGVFVTPELVSPAEGPDRGKIKTHHGRIVYKLTIGETLATWDDIGKKPGLLEVKEYRIPRSTKLVCVVYDVRIPEGGAFEGFVANFVVSSELPSKVTIPFQ